MPRQVYGLDGASEWPATRAMIPDLSGRRVVDLGCGFGWFARWARKHGTASVVGFDLSKNMIPRAKTETADATIEYRVAELETFELPYASFELAFSALAFHYIEDLERLLSVVDRALVPGSRLVFTIGHPIYMATTNRGWSKDKHGRKTWPISDYSVAGERRTDWFATGVLNYHRTLGTTLKTLIGTGFAIHRVGEFAPTAEQISKNPDLAEPVERPMMLLFSAQR